MRTLLTSLALVCALACCAVAAEGDSALKVKEGQKVPDIDLSATQIDKVLPGSTAKSLSLKDLQGKKNVVLYFYPRAMTPGCTAESCAFRDRIDEFKKLNTVIIGISTDNLDNQQKFTEKESLNFPLLADPDQKVSKMLGVMSPTGKPVTQRVTLIIDKEGKIVKIYAPVSSAKDHPEEVLKFAKENLK